MTPAAAVALLIERFTPVDIETVPLEQAAGRFLAEAVETDRPSPPSDVSAMDGFAVRCGDLAAGHLPIAGAAAIGQPAPALPPGAALRIVTGACLPAGAEAVLMHEDVTENDGRIVFAPKIRAAAVVGWHIRRKGENAPAGQQVIGAGELVSAPAAAALAAFGRSAICVYRRVRVAVLTTGDELLGPADMPAPWQIRDSNGPALRALLSPVPWIQLIAVRHAPDDPAALEAAMGSLLGDADALLTTGGVSMGERDYIPSVLAALGATLLFHKLPIRPGHPLLAAAGPEGQAIFGLPGNPLSVLATATRFAGVALRRKGGAAQADIMPALVHVNGPNVPRAELTWYRPVRLTAPGHAEVITTRGSGDLVSAATATGFIETAPGAAAVGAMPYWPWAI